MAHEYAGVVVRSRIKIDNAFIDAAANLRFIARSGSGLENIDVAYAESKGIAVYNSPEGNRDAVGEHAVGMLLMLLNNLRQADTDVRAGRWPREENRGYEIAGKTVGIIGYGLMGSSFAQKLSGFGARVIAYDKYKSQFSDQWAVPVSLEELKADADIVSLHLPLNEETHYYADAQFFASFAKPFYFINTARGPIVDETALIRALSEGWIAGAGIDVFEQEPPRPDHPLFAMDNVIVTPHGLPWTEEIARDNGLEACDNILSVARGQAPGGVVNRAVLRRPGFQNKLQRYL